MVPEPSRSSPPPVVLTIAGSDPGGGAGVQADLATFARLGVHGASAITAITVQDTHTVHGFDLVHGETLSRQIKVTLADCRVAAIKIGMLGSVENVRRVAALLAAHPGIPVVLDPVMVAGGGGALATAEVIDATRSELLPHATLITPNWAEAATLARAEPQAPRDTAAIAALAETIGATLLELGPVAALITGGDPPEGASQPNAAAPADGDGDVQPALSAVVNHLCERNKPIQRFELPRHAGVFHGSGCTLASAIAAKLALGRPLDAAVVEAQGFMVEAIGRAYRTGAGQWIPNRLCTSERRR